ncbi:MAG: aldose 1-epimerase [Acidimicrobiales bacterium]
MTSASARVESRHGVAAIVLAAGPLEAAFAPGVGMLGLSLRHEGEELLALPHGVRAYRSGHQTGLPLLAPWANRLGRRRYEIAGTTVDLDGVPLGTDANGLPIHGTMTAQTGWEILELQAQRRGPPVSREGGAAAPQQAAVLDGGLAYRLDLSEPATFRARFAYGDRPDLLAAFPFPHDLHVQATLDGACLAVSTTVRPTGPSPVPVAFGWHPYLRLPRSPRRSWRLLLPGRLHLELDERGLPTGRSTSKRAESELLGDRTFDDLYALEDDHDLAIEDGRRRVTVHFGTGYPYAQVFAPPASRFVCLEPMTGPTDALTRGECPLVAAGDESTARFSITPCWLQHRPSIGY